MDLPPNTLCAKCFKALNGKFIACHICRAKLHFFCANVDTNIGELFVKNSNIVFNCNDCLSVSSDLVARIASLTSEVRELKVLINSSLCAEVREIKKTVEKNNKPPSKEVHQQNANHYSETSGSDVVGTVQSLIIPVTSTGAQSMNKPSSQHVVSYAPSVSSVSTNDVNAVNNRNEMFEPNHQASMGWETVQRRRRKGGKVIFGENNVPNDLEVVATKKWIHISKFKPTVSCDQIINYIAANSNIDKANIECYKLVKKDANLSELKSVNFKLGVVSSFYNDIFNSKLWPTDIRVRPFKNFQKREIQPLVQ